MPIQVEAVHHTELRPLEATASRHEDEGALDTLSISMGNKNVVLVKMKSPWSGAIRLPQPPGHGPLSHVIRCFRTTSRLFPDAAHP